MTTTHEINGYTINLGTVLETSTGVESGLDVDVQVTTPGGDIVSGLVTLVPDAYSGKYARWGADVTWWASSELVDGLPREVLLEVGTVAGNACDLYGGE